MAGNLIVPSQVVTSSSTQSLPFGGFDPVRVDACVFQLDVTAAATAAGDTLDVYVQHSLDDGSKWDDFVHFTQVLGNGGAKRFIAQWDGTVTPTSGVHTANDGALAAGVNQGMVGDLWRVKWVVASASSPSFTFSVRVRAFRRR